VSPPAPHILVVHGHDPTRAQLVTRLRAAGFAVDEAADGKAARALLAAKLPDLMLLDVALSDDDGRALCERLGAEPAHAGVGLIHVSPAHEPDAAARAADGVDARLPADAIELIATVRAIVRARRAEKLAFGLARQWQGAFDAISDCVCLLDRDGAVQRCNRAFCELVGVPFAEVIGVSFEELIVPALGEAAMPVRDLSRLRTGAVVQVGFGARWHRVAADPVLDELHRPSGAVLIISDVSDERRSEDAIRRSNDELLRANRIKDEFLATLSHELRTPLNAVLGWTRLARTGQLDEATQARALETIDRNAALQAKLVDDLLDVSRIITGKLRLRIASIDPVSVIEAALHSVRPAAEAKSLRLEADLDAAADLLAADGDRLQQVLWNLLANAVKFTPAGGWVRVSLRQKPAGVSIEVVDSGSGIDAAFLPFVFDRFRQADSSTTRRHGGLGLGLAIVRHLVELHGGTVSAASDGSGRGARFTLLLPWAAPRRQPRSTGPLIATPPAPAAVSPPHDLLRGLRLLIVDDDADARELLAAALAQLGARVHVAGAAEAALEAVARARPHVLVSDIGMPGEDGYALMRRLRTSEAAGDRLPAIALTAYATKEDVGRALAAGYDLHLAKPVDAGHLARAVAALVPVVDFVAEDTHPIRLEKS
jgi:PAS domain S-box-containing protein